MFNWTFVKRPHFDDDAAPLTASARSASMATEGEAAAAAAATAAAATAAAASFGTPREEYLFLLTEACLGGELKALIGKRGVGVRPGEPPERELFWRLAEQIVRGVKDIHDAGLIHLDLKPQNILLMEDQQCRIADFGLSTNRATVVADATTTPAAGAPPPPPQSVIVETTAAPAPDHHSAAAAATRGAPLTHGGGTEGYRAPEVVKRADGTWQYTSAADIFSLGVILHEMACGAQPKWHSDRPLAALDEVARDDPKVGELVRFALRRDAAARPTAAAILEHIARCQSARRPSVRILETVRNVASSLVARSVHQRLADAEHERDEALAAVAGLRKRLVAAERESEDARAACAELSERRRSH